MLLVAIATATSACADVRRGERWDDAEDDSADDGGAAAGDDAGSAPGSEGDGDGDGGEGSTGAGGEGESGGATAPSFAEDVFEILDSGCERCHSANGQAGNTSFVLTGDVAADYEETLDFVDLGAPASSRLLAKGAGSGHVGGVIYDDDSTEYATILAWIEQGAMP